MRPGHKGALAVALAVVLAALVAAGCGYSAGATGNEGEPIQLSDIQFNVQLTRFLNPSDSEDKNYLTDQRPLQSADLAFLAVFMTMKNRSPHPVNLPAPSQMTVVDTTGARYPAIPSHTPFSVPLGAPLPGHGEIPVPDSAAASGPAQGSVVLFLVPQGISENRPLELEIQSQGVTGTITLDI
jgi:hypothetical protein